MRHTSLHLFMNDGDVWDTVSCKGLVSFKGEEGMELILWRKTLYKLVRVVLSHSNKWWLFSHFSNWASAALSLNNETCQKARHLKVDSQCVLASHSMTKSQSASTEFGQKTVIDKMKMKTVAVFPVGNYSLRQLCKLELPGNRGSKGYNAEAQNTQLWATWAWPYHTSDGSKLDSVAKSTLCWLLFCNLQPINTSEQGVCILPLTIVIQ